VELEREITEARAAGDRDRLAELLVGRADEQVRARHLDDARRLLDEAAGLHGDAGRRVDEARCLCFSAELCRATGKLELAESRAGRAERIAPPGSAPSVSAAAELGELALMRQRFDDAADAFARALQAGSAAGLVGAAEAALARKRAQALAAHTTCAEIVDLLARAAALYRDAQMPAEARKTRVEQATALEALGRATELAELENDLRAEAEAAGDDSVLDDLALLDADRHITAGATDEALDDAERARRHALEGVHPVAYVSAAIAIAELCEARGDRVRAYEVLAVGWATLGDLLGEAAAKATFAPRLEAQRERWGDDAFAAARDAYYAQRGQPA